ncbi:MAG: ComF family protein [Lachnospiraceae bacterium]|nr:ComF family protein [Lachnospiraceae bacterium]
MPTYTFTGGDGCILKNLMDILYPRRCPVCHDILKLSEGPVHSACQAKLKYVQEPVCYRCGKPVLTGDDEYCSDCMARRHYYESGHAVWVYDALMQKSIAMYKYHGAKEYADFYAQQMAAMYGSWIKSLNPDVLIPVPVHWKKKCQRGYNQAELLAKRLGMHLHFPVDTKYLVRGQWTKPQKTLTPAQRYENLKNVFYIKKYKKRKLLTQNTIKKLRSLKTFKTRKTKYPVVLLIDDIYTTGSTIDACASVLKAAGTERVYYLSLCIGSDAGG